MTSPYGSNADMLRWAKERGLRYAPQARCLHWVSKGRCAVAICQEGHGSRHWMDHISGWTKKNERILLCQPYYLHDGELWSLAEACQRFGLKAAIHGNGWYGHGTICIELTPEEQE